MNIKSFTLGNIIRRTKILIDSFRGLDFLTVIHPEEVGLDPKTAHRSSSTEEKCLYHLLADFNVSAKDAIIDVGCGKGAAMRTMLKFPFSAIDGIELSDYIAKIANTNFKNLKTDRAKIFVANASIYENYDTYNIVYLYNPFSCNIMQQVVNFLIKSVEKKDRELIILYNNPTCTEVITNNQTFKKIGVYSKNCDWGNFISVYSNRSYNCSRLINNKRLEIVAQ